MLGPADAALIAGLNDEERTIHGFPPAELVADRRRTAARVEQVLLPLLGEAVVRQSPLGPEWSSDVDVHAAAMPDASALEAAGWLPLARLLARVGIVSQRWAVVDGGCVVGAVDLVSAPAPAPGEAVLARALRRREVRLREVLELRVLHRAGEELPAEHVALAAAAALERAWGGTDLAAWLAPDSPTIWRDPVALAVEGPFGGMVRRVAGAARRAARPRLVVAFSGVDGSGKSSLAMEVARQLERAGVPTTTVWSRPGMRLGILGRAGMAVRRRRYGATPGVRAVAAGEADVPVRQGFAGWLWATAVAAAYVVDVRRRHASARGIVLYDRHLLDGIVTLDFVYAGVDLRVARRLVRLALPRADAAFYVRVPAEVAVARKPGDSFGEHAVRRQLVGYDDRLPLGPDLVVLEGTRPREALAAEVLRRLAAVPPRYGPRG